MTPDAQPAPTGGGLRVLLLGPFRGERSGAAVGIPIGVSRGIVARLALADGAALTGAELVDELWDEPTEAALGTVRSQLSRLRTGPLAGLIDGGHAGYSLRADDVDVRALLRDADAALVEADDEERRAALAGVERAASAGTPLEDLDQFPFARRVRARVTAVLARVTEELADLRIAAGEAADAIAPLQRLVDAEPLRESAVLRLGTALAAAGRPADALEALDAHRERLREEHGLDPSAEWQRVRAGVVRRDPATVAPTASVERHGVAAALTRLVGREPELAAIAEARTTSRLVTLVGPGGVGKTRLAMEAARRSTDDEVQWAVELAHLPADGDVLAHIAETVGARAATIDAVATRLGERRTLLVLDNAEHVLVPAAAVVADLLARRDGLAVLVTSREALHLPGERLVPIEPWDADGTDAVRLFLDRVRDVRPGFDPAATELDLVRTICGRLDGLPLGIEIVASSADVLDLTELAGSIESDDPLAGPSRDPRHRNLASVIDWSYELLSPVEQDMLGQLAGFAGTFSLEAVAGICIVEGDPRRLTAALAQKNLVAVAVGDDGVRRYRLLESVRRYAAARHPGSRRAEFATRHLAWHADFFDRGAPELRGRSASAWHAAFDATRPDLLLALAEAEAAGDRAAAMRLTAGWAYHAMRRNTLADGRALLERADRIPGEVSPELETWFLASAGLVSYHLGDGASVSAIMERALPVAERCTDPTPRTLLLGYDRYRRALSPDREAVAARFAGFELEIPEGTADWVRAETLVTHGQLLRALGRPAEALDVLEAGRRLAAEVGHSWIEGTASYLAGRILLDLRNGKAAAQAARLGLAASTRDGSQVSPLTQLDVIAGATAYLERQRDGARLYGAIGAIGRRYGYDVVEVEGEITRRLREPVRRALTAEEWEAAIAEGERMSLRAAIDLALSLVPAR